MLFGEEYQKELLLRATVKSWMEKVGHLLAVDYFDPALEPVVERILSHWTKHRKVLTLAQVRQLASRNEIKLPGTRPNPDHVFDLEEIEAFAFDRILKDAQLRSAQAREKGQWEKAIQVLEDCRKKWPKAQPDSVVDVLQSTHSLPSRRNLVLTGLPKLDDILEGGVGGGDLSVVLAPTSGGKTSFLVFLACQAVLKKLRVVYYTLEVPCYEIEAKVRRCLTGKAKVPPKDWKKASQKYKRAGLRVVEHAPYSVTIEELKVQVDRDVNMVIVDYADYLRPPSGSIGFEYADLGQIYNHLKALGMSRHIPVWTASQVNRAAYQREMLSLADVEASLRKVMAADQVIALNQDQGAKEFSPGEYAVKLSVVKNRHGIRNVDFDVSVDWRTSRFSMEE